MKIFIRHLSFSPYLCYYLFMKKLFNLIFIILIIFISSFTTFVLAKNNYLNVNKENNFYPTQADMLNFSNKSTIEIENLFNKICDKIIQIYSNDKSFIKAFKKDKEEFNKYKFIQRDVVLPHIEDPTYYGSNYSISSDSYLNELILNKINQYKRSIKLYCLYNDFNHDKSACSDKTIESIFTF